MGWDKVSDKKEDGHHDVFSNGNYIGSGNLGDSDVVLVGSIQIDVACCQLGISLQKGNLLGSDTGSDCELELLCLLKEISSEVSWVEGSGDQNLGLSRQLSSLSLKVVRLTS